MYYARGETVHSVIKEHTFMVECEQYSEQSDSRH